MVLFRHLLVGSTASVNCSSVGQTRLQKRFFLDVLICFFDGSRGTSNKVFVLIHSMCYREWGILCTCYLVALQVSIVHHLASQYFKNRYCRCPDLLFDGLRETSNMVFDHILMMFYCEWCFLIHLLVDSPAIVDCLSVGQPTL